MMCGVNLSERMSLSESAERLQLKTEIISCLEFSQLCWFGHVCRYEETNLIKIAYDFKVEGKGPRGQPQKTWDNSINSLSKTRNLQQIDTLNRVVLALNDSGGHR
jgi:hypothetical protein